MLIEDFAELPKLNDAIDQILSELVTTTVTDDSYTKLADQLTKLTKIKQIIVETKLKDFDSEEKAFQFRQNHDQKNTELAQKKAETERTLDLKMRELEGREDETQDERDHKKSELEFKIAEAKKPDRVSKDALVAAGASIAGILMIISYEKVNVIASKALGFVLKR